MKTFEYKVVLANSSDSHVKFAKVLNDLGTEGWELVGIEHGYGGHAKHFIFKREHHNYLDDYRGPL